MRLVIFIGVLIAFIGLISLYAAAKKRRTTQDAQGVVARRPGWTVEENAPEVRMRYQRAVAWHHSRPSFNWLMAGPMPGGARAETVRVESEHSTGRNSTNVRRSTIATVIFPFTLPTVSLGPDDSRAAARPQPVAPGQLDWTGAHGQAEDPQAAAVLFTADQLDDVRARGREWWMQGHAVVLSVRRPYRPEEMLQLVDEAAALVGRLPAEVLQRAAAQPDPWPGPTAGRPG